MSSYLNREDVLRIPTGTIHINPSFALGVNVHINPRFLTKNSTIPQVQQHNFVKEQKATVKHCVRNASSYSWKREAHPPLKSSSITSTTTQHRHMVNSAVHSKDWNASTNPYKLNKTTSNITQGSLNKLKSMVCVSHKTSKINNIKNIHSVNNFSSQKTKVVTPSLFHPKISLQKRNIYRNQNKYKIQNLFPKIISIGSKYKVNKSGFKKRPQSTIKVEDFSSIKRNIKKKSVFGNKKIVNIGGIIYKATSNSLTRTGPETSPKKVISAVLKKSCLKSKKINQNFTINIRGESFVLSKNGKTLRRLPGQQNVAYPKQRVDFGGVTFRQASSNVLVRTESHRVRSLLLQSKQRSIACLTARHRKNNIPCIVFQKLGRCRRLDRGSCSYTHDRKTVALCKRFLNGSCTEKDCPLSHDVVHQKVSTCRFFLEGFCTRENCPYLHVKVSDKASVCSDFLRGYCELGEQCPMKHINVCPAFDKLGYCKKGKNCPYPHTKAGQKVKKEINKKKWRKPTIKNEDKTKIVPGSNGQRKRRRKSDDISLMMKPSNSGQEPNFDYHFGESPPSQLWEPLTKLLINYLRQKAVRYYIAEKETQEENVLEVLPKRSRLHTLPSYIAIDSDSTAKDANVS